MPHDRDGKLLHVGDVVYVPAHVTAIEQTEEFCNVTLATSQPMYPGHERSTLTLNAKQVVRVEPTMEQRIARIENNVTFRS